MNSRFASGLLFVLLLVGRAALDVFVFGALGVLTLAAFWLLVEYAPVWPAFPKVGAAMRAKKRANAVIRLIVPPSLSGHEEYTTLPVLSGEKGASNDGRTVRHLGKEFVAKRLPAPPSPSVRSAKPC